MYVHASIKLQFVFREALIAAILARHGMRHELPRTHLRHVCVVLCVGRRLATGLSLVQRVLRTVYRIQISLRNYDPLIMYFFSGMIYSVSLCYLVTRCGLRFL